MINPFIIIVDRDGDVVDTMGGSSTIDEVFQVIRHLNLTNPGDGPHTAWEWQGKNLGWKKVEP